MIFEIKVVFAPLPCEDNNKRIVRLARLLLWACDYLESREKTPRRRNTQRQIDASWETDDLDLVLMSPAADRKSEKRK